VDFKEIGQEQLYGILRVGMQEEAIQTRHAGQFEVDERFGTPRITEVGLQTKFQNGGAQPYQLLGCDFKEHMRALALLKPIRREAIVH